MSEPQQPLEYATPAPRARPPVGWIILTIIVMLLLVGIGGLFVTGRRVAVVVTPAPPPAPAPVVVTPPTVPLRITVTQRSYQPLPGTGGSIVARIGDITGGQVLLTVQDANQLPLVSTISVREGDVQTFTVGNSRFEIELLELKNFLTGDDFAVFEIRQAGTGLSEAERIDRLLQAIAEANDVVFIRNGDEHSAADAAAHLRRKYEAAGDQNMTARQFIDHIASRSSLSGAEYRVRRPDGTELTSAQWLSEQLAQIPPSSPARAATTRPAH